MSTSSLLRLTFTGGVSCLALGLGACTEDEPTEIVAGVSTQMRVPEGLEAVGLVVQSDGQLVFCESYPVVDGTARLPATLGVLGETRFRRAPGGLVTVQVLGFRTVDSPFATDCIAGIPDASGDDPNQVVVVRRRRTSFVDGKILFLPLPIKESCNDTSCSAADGLTCIGGACVSMDIEAERLPEYREPLIFGNTNTCFSTDLCVPDQGGVPVLLDDPRTCTFRAQWPNELGTPSAGDLNVRVFYDTFGTEVLDLDPETLDESQYDGLSFVDDADPLLFRLAPNVCETNYKQDKILGLEANARCPTKRPFQPICEAEDDAAEPDAGVSPLEDELAGQCTIASLSSVESAAYVLMDSSFSMFRYFGDGGLQFAVGLPLDSPIARRTRLAFGLLPAEAAQCDAAPTDNAFASPRIPFGDVTDVRGPIGDLLGDGGVVLPDNPPLLMEAAFEGAYQALGALDPVQSSRFNRRALVVIANRDFGGECATDGVTPAQRANAALTNQQIYTYSVVLQDGNDPAAVAEATEIANQGGTTVFNGVADAAEGAAAVQRILNDLGSCLYEVRAPLTGDVRLPDDAEVSYLNPLLPSRSRVGIPRNEDCSEENQDAVSGWSQGGDDLVRICGQACDDLRETLDVVAVTHAVEAKVSPPVPLVVTARCPPSSAFD